MVMVYRNIRQVPRDWQWIAALLCIVLMLAPGGARAGIQEIRVVAVGIDSSSVAAEEKAMDYARKRAVYLASRKLGIKNVSKVVAKFSEKQFNDIIRGANVVQTRRQGEVTYSEVNVTIVDEALRRALKLPDAPAVAAADLKVRGVLLVPVYVGRERAFLWEKENQLRQPLWDEVRRQSKAGILLPGGDFDDLRLIDYQNALTVKVDELTPMFERYGAEEIIIAVMTPSTPGTTDASSVLLRRLNISGEERHEVIEVPPESIEEASTIRLNKTASAIANAVTQIASSTAEREQAVRAQAKQLKVRFSYAIPKDLAFMQDAVRKAPETMYLDLPSIALAQVTGTIYLKGDDEALRASLVKQGVIVTTINDGWRLSIR
jgi:hypothetical protein